VYSEGDILEKYADPAVEAAWLCQQQARVMRYLRLQKVRHGGVAARPDWFCAPFVSVWPVADRLTESTALWVISGDLPTDYIESSSLPTARTALGAFKGRWKRLAELMVRGEAHPEFSIAGSKNGLAFGRLLGRRALSLQAMADDDNLWEAAF
jgi:hypothetical protein